ncbi:MAG: EAL domain-containing protein, partial [Pseudomonadota bacterium]
GLIEELGRFVLYEAARQLGIWQRAFRPKQPLFMSINVSHAQLLGRHLVDEVRTLLSREDLADGTLKLEITESMVMENPELSVQVLRRLKQLGVGLACDDFGTGYSSLATLQRLPFDVLKLDKSFLEADPEDDSAEIILQSIIDLADNLDMAVVAEGVESAEQAERLQDMGCDFGQGYLFGEPMTSRKVIDSLGGSALLLRYTTAKTGGFLKRLVGGGKSSGEEIALDLPEERERRPFRPAAEAAIPPPPAPPQPAPPPAAPARQFEAPPPPPAAPAARAPRPLDDGFSARPATPLRSEPKLTADVPPPGGRRLPARTDELTRIAGIDADTARILAQMNYGTYRKIANLTTSDITLVDDKLGSPGRVEREEWIRQANEILIGKPPTPPDPNVARPRAPAAAKPEPERSGFAGFAPPSLAGQKKDAGPPSRFEARLDQISSGMPQTPPPPAPAAPPPAAAAAPVPAPAASAPAPAAEPRPAEDERDDLSLIAGIGPTIANELNGLGIQSFRQLAALSDDEAERVNEQTGFPGRVEREEWREQAAELMAGRPPRAKVDQEQLAAAQAAPEPAPAPAPEPTPAPPQSDDLALISGIGPAIAKSLNDYGITTFQQLAALSGEEVGRVNDHVGFPGRVEREEWREQAKELMEGKPPRAKVDRQAKAAKKMPAPAPKADGADAPPSLPPPAKDDLTKIKGIGPALARELHNMGFHTFRQLSELDPDQIEQVNDQIGFPGRVERENWIGQARDFAA